MAPALRIRAVECRPGDAGLVVTVAGVGGGAGAAVTPNEPGVAEAVVRLAEAWGDVPLLATEFRWQRWGRAAMESRPERLAYGALDLACAFAASAALGVPLSTLIGGEAGGDGGLDDRAEMGISFDTLAGPGPLGRAALRGDAVAVEVPLASAGGLGGLRRVAAVARALNMQVRLRAGTGSALEREQAAALGRAFGCRFADVAAVQEAEPRRIRRIRLRRVRIPLVNPYVSAMYLTQEVRRTIIELECDDGIVGLGETGGSDEIWQLARRLARPLVGADVFDRRGFAHRFAPVSYANANGRSGFQASGGLELACWDASAKSVGMPLADLLGRGDPAEDVAAVCLLPAAGLDRLITRDELAAHFADLGNVRRLVDHARAARERYGFSCFKYKSVGNNARWDLAVMRGLREGLGPEAQLRFDPNAAYDTADAAALCRAMEPLALQFYEDPTDGIEGLARLRRGGLTRPIATNMVLIHFDHFAPVVRRGAIDVLLADLFHWGGVENFRDMAAAAEAFGLQPALHSFYETGLATAANLHLALGLGLTSFANDQGHEGLAEDVLAPDALHIRGGRMALPPGPGLGVALDEARMGRLTTDEVVLGGEGA